MEGFHELSSLRFNPRRERSRSKHRHGCAKRRETQPSQPDLPQRRRNREESHTTETATAGETPCPTQWLGKLLQLPPAERTAYVLAWVVECVAEKLLKENHSTHAVRWQGLGLVSRSSDVGPRGAISIIKETISAQHTTAERTGSYMDMEVSTAMIASIAQSAKSYASGLRCWGAFCDVMAVPRHFPAEQCDVLRFKTVFRNVATYSQYLKHLRFAHRLLRMKSTWYDEVVKQVERGGTKLQPIPLERPALLASQVRAVIRAALSRHDLEMATLYSVARLFLLRVPSEALPLERNGEHSRIEIEGGNVHITLYKRKNTRKPSVLHRSCVCANEGRSLCAVCSLKSWLARPSVRDRLFNVSTHSFLKYLRRDIASAGVRNAENFGSHAFRRGMARDIVAAGGTLATLLLAGQWSSGAYRAYLQGQAIDEQAIAKLVIDQSDDECT